MIIVIYSIYSPYNGGSPSLLCVVCLLNFFHISMYISAGFVNIPGHPAHSVQGFERSANGALAVFDSLFDGMDCGLRRVSSNRIV